MARDSLAKACESTRRDDHYIDSREVRDWPWSATMEKRVASRLASSASAYRRSSTRFAPFNDDSLDSMRCPFPLAQKGNTMRVNTGSNSDTRSGLGALWPSYGNEVSGHMANRSGAATFIFHLLPAVEQAFELPALAATPDFCSDASKVAELHARVGTWLAGVRRAGVILPPSHTIDPAETAAALPKEPIITEMLSDEEIYEFEVARAMLLVTELTLPDDAYYDKRYRPED
ncbi:hypothetical protein NMY22_g7066 [Coprinellus aureogranulatus]|nr:hypothetical protein NMY22_g7066 [Coprinellus aureogranulatus]